MRGKYGLVRGLYRGWGSKNDLQKTGRSLSVLNLRFDEGEDPECRLKRAAELSDTEDSRAVFYGGNRGGKNTARKGEVVSWERIQAVIKQETFPRSFGGKNKKEGGFFTNRSIDDSLRGYRHPSLGSPKQGSRGQVANQQSSRNLRGKWEGKNHWKNKRGH